uniref:Monodehydroascorbate reductase n=1 Tax=Tanacetum cinerariifolium TaxID=118510 RepID=A0A6L2N1R0_TANCI|nr:hypothetical protein [Tanacetum cinerariifolium]
MADINILANDAPAEQAPAVAPPTRTDDQILPLSNWVPIGKSNCVLDVQKSQRNPIFLIVVALPKNTNFFKAFTASSTIPAIYIQQFWDTMRFNTSTGLYSCQLDEQWFNLHKDLLRDALDITPTNDSNPFVAPPLSDTVIEYVNTLGYPSTLRNVSAMSVNALYQPWRTILSMINMCLTGKTTGYDKPRHPVLQILWGIIHSFNIDYAKRIWEEFVQSIQTFLTDRNNLATASLGKKKTTHLLIPSIRFTKLIINHLKTKHNIHPRSGLPLHYSHDESVLNTLRYVGKYGREIFDMPILNAQLTDEIKGSPYYSEYQEHVAKYQQHLDAEHGKAAEGGATESFKATKVTKPKATKATKPASYPKPKPAPTQPSKAVPEKKQKLVRETPDEPSPAKRSKGGLVRKIRKPMSSLKLVDEPSAEDAPVEEPAYNEEEANLQLALELRLKEQAEQTHRPARPVVIREPDSGRIQPLSKVQGKGKEKRHTSMPAEASGPVESPSLDAKLALTDSETEPDDEVPKINTGDQNEGQAGPNPGKTNAEAEVQSMVSVLIHEDTSSVPLMTTSTIDLTPRGKVGQAWVPAIQIKEFNIPYQVSKVGDEIVTDAVDWAMQAPLRAHFSDQPTVDIKEILKQRMFESKSYEAHEDHKKLKRHDVPRTPSGSPPPQPPPPPSLAGASCAPDDSIPDEHTHLFDDEDSGNDHLPKADSRKDWWKPLPEEERPVTPGPAWTIPSSNTRDMTNFLSWYCRQVNKNKITQADLEGQDYEVVKAFYLDVIHLQFQMKECHKLLTDQVDWTNPEGDQVRVEVNRPLPLGGPPSHVTIQSQFFFNKDLEYLRHSSKGSSHALSISKIKVASYLDFDLELLVPDVVRIKAYLRYEYDYLSEIVLRRAVLQEHTIAEKDFKNLHLIDFEDPNLLLLQGHLDHLPGSDKRMLSTDVKLWTRNLVIRQWVEDFQLVVFSVNNTERKIMRFNEIYKFSDGTLTQILEALAYRVKEFKIKRLNPGMNTRFWTQKDVKRSKEFIAAIERRLKTRRIYRNLECFVGGRVRDIDYRLLQRTK